MDSIKWGERIKRKTYNSVSAKLGTVRRSIEKTNVTSVLKSVVLEDDKGL